jgi:hypothetical protein
MNPRDPSEYGGDSPADIMNPKEPSQAELDADRAANPDRSKQVAGAERRRRRLSNHGLTHLGRLANGALS